jgi:hypothetical protein
MSLSRCPGRVRAHVSRGVAGGRQAAAAVALVEDDDPELLRVERPPVSRRAPHSWAAVHDQRWHAIGVPAGLPVHEVPVTGVQQAGLVGLDIRIRGHAKIVGAMPLNLVHASCRSPSVGTGITCTSSRRLTV